jgi:ABC-type transport system involved in multi-copper enzyme maturation permease subunit
VTAGLRRLSLPRGRRLAGISAVLTKELRGRMRGRRAFLFLTFYLTVLTGFAWMVSLIAERSFDNDFNPANAMASAQIGHALFIALLLLETLLVLFLAPAYTTGAISLEREKQTLDLLVTTPVSSLAIVLGKLFSALTFVFLLILSSIPLTAVVFVFGGVGPEDVVRGYLVLLVTAVGLGSIGLFCSALVRRTQAATILTYFTVLTITLGAMFVFIFWNTMTGWVAGGPDRREDNLLAALSRRAPALILYLNPFISQVDVMCASEGELSGWCDMIRFIDGRPDRFVQVPVDPNTGAPLPNLAPPGGPNAVANSFWPKAAAVWLGLSLVLILLSAQLVAPTRRWRFRKRRAARPVPADAAGEAADPSGSAAEA